MLTGQAILCGRKFVFMVRPQVSDPCKLSAWDVDQHKVSGHFLVVGCGGQGKLDRDALSRLACMCDPS